MALDKNLMYRELGVLGNTFENLTIQYVKSEMVDKAEQGDTTALYNLERVARYSEVPEVATYARQQFDRITGTVTETVVDPDKTDPDKTDPDKTDPGELGGGPDE